MKDITISGARIKTELIYLLFCFAFAVLMNVFAIVKYNTSWSELFSQLHVVFLLSCVLYFLAAIVRMLIRAVKKFF